ncbi:VWA domain-containing protein [Neorhodopirellula lusitana]|uniref:VWA domain-containing protein n=1 Tax=Neorhodopirellula lusitana TaxID=445327 RepID=UPI00384D4CBA
MIGLSYLMNSESLQVLAQTSVGNSTPAAQSPTERIVYEFARAETLDGWWVWAAIVLAVVIGTSLCYFFYRRDVAELPRPVRWTLIGLRLTVILALVFLFFDLVRRTERRVTRPSEVVVLVDTSQSMSLPADGTIDAPSRIQRTIDLIDQAKLIETFGDNHRTSVYSLGGPEGGSGQPELITTSAAVTGVDADESGNGETTTSNSATTAVTTSDLQASTNPFVLFGLFCLTAGAIASGLALFTGASAGLRGRASASDATQSTTALRGGSQASRTPTSSGSESVGWFLLVAAITLGLGIISLGSVYAVRTEQSFRNVVGLDNTISPPTDSSSEPASEKEDEGPKQQVVDWETALAANDAQSRIGDALRSILVDHDLTTLAGVVIITDGQNNGGAPLSSALSLARRGEVSLYPIGLGSSRPPTNVRVVDLEAPRRVYPGDKFAVASVLQATGPTAMDVEVELIDALDTGEANNSGNNDNSSNGSDQSNPNTLAGGQVLQTQKVHLEPDASLSGIRFEIEPQTVGRRRLAVRIVAPREDRNSADDMQTARYEVVARKLKVLAIAGGPTREYRFVRNLLYRDESVELDVWLQTGRTGMSQDADQLLTEFPPTAEDLFAYDAVMMFDPDWSAIDSASLDLIDRFLTQQAGGLILVAGPVYHPKITSKRGDTRSSQINGFFPVNLATRGPLLGGGRQGGRNAWPLEFTPEASTAEFLWIADTPEESFEIWNEYGSVYDYVGVKSAKPGAKAYAYFSDPTTEVSGSLPIFAASQFYGAGRVYFQGSGEMWRLRAAGDQYFDSYYTKLIRWVSEGRLLRDSNRGVLLVDASRVMVGQTVTLRAVLVDDQFQPLTDPFVTAKLLTPDGKIKDIRMSPAADSPRGGTYTGNFVATTSGGYEVQLTVGDALDEQTLRQTVQVRLPTSELERPRRADEELQQLASTTRGLYFPVDTNTSISSIAQELTTKIEPQPQITLLAGTPDRLFGERRNAVLMWLIASLLTFEWITRRLHRLA